MEMKFSSRAEIGGAAVGAGEGPARGGGGAMTPAALPPAKRNDRMLCGTPLSVTVKSEALRLVARDWSLCRTTTSSTTSDRKSTRLNSSHLGISYAVFCL